MESFSQSIQSGADQKANEYAERIRKGEDPEQVMQGLGPAFVVLWKVSYLNLNLKTR